MSALLPEFKYCQRMSEKQAEFVRRQPPVESAAAAGIIYSLLATIAFLSIDKIPAPSSSELEWTEWIEDGGNRAMLILFLNLASVSAVAFLWFVAVIRRRVGDREDRRLLVVVDRDGVLRAFHADPVLGGTRDAGSDVDGGLDDLAGLADLVAVGNPTGVDNGPRCAGRTLEQLGDCPL